MAISRTTWIVLLTWTILILTLLLATTLLQNGRLNSPRFLSVVDFRSSTGRNTSHERENIMRHLASFATKIQDAVLELDQVPPINDSSVHKKQAEIMARSKSYMDEISKIAKLVMLKVPTSVFYNILPPRLYAIHSNDCKGIQTRSIGYTDIYDLNCVQLGNPYTYVDVRNTKQLADRYDFHPGLFHSNSQSSVQRRQLEKGITTVGYVLVLKDAFITPDGDFAIGNNYVKILRCHDRQRRTTIISSKATKYDKVFSIAQYWGGGFFHFFIEDLPRTSLALPFLRQNKDIKVHVKAKNGFTVSWIEQLGIAADRLVTGLVRAKTAIIPPGTSCGTASVIPTNLLMASLQTHQYTNRDTIVLIRRSTKRWFGHHDSILAMLRKVAARWGLNVKVFSDRPAPGVEATKQMFGRAILVVGPHGAGLSNLVLVPSGGCVVEGLCYDGSHRLNLCYKHLAQVLGHVYHGVVPRKQCMDITADDVLYHVEKCLHNINPR